MITDVTLKFVIPQAELDLYDVAAAAEVLGKPSTRRGRWIFRVDCQDYDPHDDEIAADCAGLTYWTDTVRRDLSDILTPAQIDLVEECLEVDVETEDEDGPRASHYRSMTRALFAGRRAA